MVTIATFNEPAKAKHLKERLRTSGIEADIHNEKHGQAVHLVKDAQANMKVQVHEQDFGKAQGLLVEWEASDPDVASALRCPQCKSPRIQYPQTAQKFPFIPGLYSILLALGVFEKEFYCEDCHLTWGKDGNPASGA
jgi:predicted Zn-ribbon and HTH transcriptional regulator